MKWQGFRWSDGVNLGGHQLNLILSPMKSQFFFSFWWLAGLLSAIKSMKQN